ncbi:MAG: hypothetical protein H6739_03915 [Alphaproteobacteria bacterium]|nr:hypothetical protein [Alphaproteobacteria bacterium]
MTPRTLLLLALPLGACQGKFSLAGGPEPDARLTADVFTWECQDPYTEQVFQGVFSFDVSLEYAPDTLQDRVLPGAGGCSEGLSMFPYDAGEGGEDLPGLSSAPTWTTGDQSGRFERLGPGFYLDEVLSNVHSCADAAEMLGDGLTLDDAGPLTGVTAPPAGSIAWVDTDITDDDGDRQITFGETVDVTWDASDWDEAWLQIRQEREGEAWGTVTCAAGSGDSFTITDDVWDLLNEQLNVEFINLYVGFQNSDVQETDDGLQVEVVTRGTHVLVVQEL